MIIVGNGGSGGAGDFDTGAAVGGTTGAAAVAGAAGGRPGNVAVGIAVPHFVQKLAPPIKELPQAVQKRGVLCSSTISQVRSLKFFHAHIAAGTAGTRA